MNETTSVNPQIHKLNKFLKEFQKESDRGAAIFAANALDEKFKNILASFLINGKSTDTLLEGFNAPLGTFAARQHMVFSLGLINEYEYTECEIIRKIRNEFAHKFEMEFSFNDPKVSKLCLKFISLTPGDKKEFLDKPRFLFTNAVIIIYKNLLFREDYIKGIKLKRPDWQKIYENRVFTPADLIVKS